MRLTDRCEVTQDGTTVGGSRPCSFGHTGGGVGVEAGHIRYREEARVIIGPDAQLAAVADPGRLRVRHKDRTYNVTAILPRYRTHGRLHHVSLDVQVVTG